MSAWLEQLSPERRADLVQLWMELGRALLGEAADHFRDVREMVPKLRDEALPRCSEEQARTKKPRNGKLTPALLVRLHELFGQGMSARQAFGTVQRDLGESLPIGYKYVSHLKTQWKKAQTGPEAVTEPGAGGQTLEYMTDELRERLFELFDDGLRAMEAHRRLCEEYPNRINFTYTTTYYWMCKWKEARKAEKRLNQANQGQTGPEPT